MDRNGCYDDSFESNDKELQGMSLEDVMFRELDAMFDSDMFRRLQRELDNLSLDDIE